jgi:hypothetical protein
MADEKNSALYLLTANSNSLSNKSMGELCPLENFSGVLRPIKKLLR